MFDSVFNQFIQFSGTYEREAEILSALNELESSSASSIKGIPEAAGQHPETFELTILKKLSQALWGTWLLGWNLGEKHAKKEVGTQRREKLFSNLFSIVEFSKKQAENRSIRNIPAENAIKARINQLAKDVSNSEYARIKESLLAAISPQDGREPISRSELVKQIQETLGTKTGRFANRAQTIARTELTFAYNAGRLNSYRESGLVESVRFYTISDERRCPICASRQGLTIPLSDWMAIAKNSAPLHPNCRCLWTAVLKQPGKKPESPKDTSSLVPLPSPWMSAAILAAVLIGGKGSGMGAASKIVSIASATAAIQKAKQEEKKVAQEEKPIAPAPTQETQRIQFLVGNVDLNTATREEIQALLPGRSLSVRQVNEIIRRREQQPFTSVDDLKNIPTIGGKTLERLTQLAEGSAIVPLLDPNNIRTPAQLWATNLGLTRTQANTIFQELRKGTFKDIDDLKARLKGRGIGEQTIKNMQERAAIVRRHLDTRNIQGVGGQE